MRLKYFDIHKNTRQVTHFKHKNINKAIVDIRLRPRCAIAPPTSRPIVQRVCLCRLPLHRPVQFAIIRGIRLVGQMFSSELPLSLSSPHVTHCSSGQAHSSSQTASRSVQPFLWVTNATLYNALSVWKKTQNCHFPSGFRNDAGRGPSHGHKQQAQIIDKYRACGSGDILADRQTDIQTDRQTHTHTNVPVTILRNRSRRRSNNTFYVASHSRFLSLINRN